MRKEHKPSSVFEGFSRYNDRYRHGVHDESPVNSQQEQGILLAVLDEKSSSDVPQNPIPTIGCGRILTMRFICPKLPATVTNMQTIFTYFIRPAEI